MEAPAGPRQRILQADGRRYSLKLEEPFWEALDLAARERGLKLGRLVAQLAAELPGSGNLASQLRLFCLAEGQRRLHVASGRPPRPALRPEPRISRRWSSFARPPAW